MILNSNGFNFVFKTCTPNIGAIPQCEKTAPVKI